MPTVVVRFETCKKAIGYGTVYYRIYKGHNRRMEFSSHLHLPTSSWDETTKTIRGEHPKACLFRAQMEADLRLLNRIITEDVTGRLTMGDMIAIFKHQRTIIVNTQFRAYPFYKASEWMPHKKLLLNSIVF